MSAQIVSVSAHKITAIVVAVIKNITANIASEIRITRPSQDGMRTTADQTIRHYTHVNRNKMLMDMECDELEPINSICPRKGCFVPVNDFVAMCYRRGYKRNE
uniref:Uncharacterized protein n=1 Tax=Glossina pallidipes TaxID=7398 RepID=A0A1B0A7F8_GLOPL